MGVKWVKGDRSNIIDSRFDPPLNQGEEMITELEINNWFTYHSPKGTQGDRYIALREKAKELAMLILENTPASADQTASIRKLRECIMTANAAIACGE